MVHNVGMRVGALLSCSKEELKLLGYGIYEGDFHAPGTPSFEEMLADPEVLKPEGVSVEELRKVYENNRFLKNPRIRLDNGTIVWGKECWWGPEKDVQARVKGHPNVVLYQIQRNDKGLVVDYGPTQ